MIFSNRGAQKDSFHAEALPHLDALFCAAIYMTKDRRDAEDLVQETLLKAFRFWHRYQKGTNCKAWLFRILTNTHINRNRGKHKDVSLLEHIDVEPNVDTPLSDRNAYYKGPEDSYLHGLVHDDVKAAVMSLPDDFRIPVVLSDLHDFSYREIAEVMDCPIGTVMSRLHRGRKILQKKLKTHATAVGVLVENEPPTSLSEYRAKKVQQSTNN